MNHHKSRTMKKSREYETISHKKIPVAMRHPFIVNGYRLLEQPWYYYVISLFKWHNETLNIWSHLFAGMLILFQAARFGQQHHLLDTLEGQKILMFAIGSFSMTMCSSVAHLLSSRSARTHVLFFLLDYSGIALYGYSTSVSSIAIFGQKWIVDYIEAWFLPVSCLIGALTCFVNCGAKVWVQDYNSWTRKLLMVFPHVLFGVFISLPVLPRYWSCYQDDACALASLNHMNIIYFLFIFEGLVYTMHIPEKWIPGRYDIIGQSHQAFHVCTWITIATQMYAFSLEMQTGSSQQLDFNFTKALLGFIILFIANILIILSFIPVVNKNPEFVKNRKKKTKSK